MTDKDEPLDTRGRLLRVLRECAENYDHEAAHATADDALLDFIDDDEIREAFNRIEKWYA